MKLLLFHSSLNKLIFQQTLECLKSHQKELSIKCHKTIFNREKEEMQDNSIDYALISTCKPMIKKYCSDTEMSQVRIFLLTFLSILN